jgi:hypothetical protein
LFVSKAFCGKCVWYSAIIEITSSNAAVLSSEKPFPIVAIYKDILVYEYMWYQGFIPVNPVKTK